MARGNAGVYDAIVVGLGAVGGAALFHLAKRGLRVLGLERFAVGHDRGSSHGHSRVIRKAYFEHPDYVPLLEVAYAEWGALERRLGQRLYHPTGVLQVGPEDGEVLQGVLRSARDHGLEVETFAAPDLAARYPCFSAPPGHVGVLERAAGVIEVEAAVRGQVAVARGHGAEVRVGARVTGLRAEADRVEIELGGERLFARRAVVAAGPFTRELLGPEATGPLQLLGKTQLWYPAPASLSMDAGCPAFLFEGERGVFYGIPAFGGRGVKVAQHSGGEPLVAADARSRPVPPEERAAVGGFVQDTLRGVGAAPEAVARCLYTCTPDGHFVVDGLEGRPHVQIVAGLSGHGFKLAPALGRAVAERLVDGGTALEVAFLRRGRPSLAGAAGAGSVDAEQLDAEGLP